MPTITYDKKDLQQLIGERMSDEQLEDVTNLIKPTVEKITQVEITIELTADRPDLFGIEGLARAIRQYLELEGMAKYKVAPVKLTVKVTPVPVRPYVASAVVRNVKINDETIKSLMNIQEVLHETIGRKRKKVAIGLHDLDKIQPPISYKGVSRDTKMTPLQSSKEMILDDVLTKVPKGKAYAHLISSARLWPVLEDREGIFSFPPVINSDRTKITPKTKNIFVDVTGTNRETVGRH
jgi:phenylalanyl-tRNA synthetase beta chain